jgi:hypothetical protein
VDVAKFEAVPWNLARENEENDKKLLDGWLPGRNSNQQSQHFRRP